MLANMLHKHLNAQNLFHGVHQVEHHLPFVVDLYRERFIVGFVSINGLMRKESEVTK